MVTPVTVALTKLHINSWQLATGNDVHDLLPHDPISSEFPSFWLISVSLSLKISHTTSRLRPSTTLPDSFLYFRSLLVMHKKYHILVPYYYRPDANDHYSLRYASAMVLRTICFSPLFINYSEESPISTRGRLLRTVFQGPLPKFIQDVMWLTAGIGLKGLLSGCVHRQSGSC